jgi:hypothetical protein
MKLGDARLSSADDLFSSDVMNFHHHHHHHRDDLDAFSGTTNPSPSVLSAAD